MIRKLTLIILLIYTGSVLGQKNKKPSIDSITIDMKKSEGLITTYLKNDKLYFELDKTVLEKELLMVTRFSQFPGNFSSYTNAGSKTAENVISFKLSNNNIVLKKLAYTNEALDKDPIKISVIKNNFPPILAVFKIENGEKDKHLIDVSNYFMNDSPGFNLIRKTDKERFKIGSIDKKRSFINQANSYPMNTEIKNTITYSANNLPRSNNSKTLSFEVNHSIISLPESLMQVRYLDNRIGWFSLNKVDYSSEQLKSDEYQIIRRWRLEPKDIEAYNNGELTEPKKPIIYYLDPATPKKWRPYFKKGIEDWNIAFEKAGFKNAIIAKDPPSKEEDPNFSPEDIRYSTVRYVASKTRNATGPSVSDPRTGEIIESDIIWYHNHLRSYRNRYLLETGAANPKARTLNTPETEIGEMMRRVISHEIGHALGLPHNMKASSAYPVDSLRSGKFTQKMGIAATIMDYARYNYVAQPGDKNIRFVRKLGPYDEYSIEWGYRFFSDKNELEIDSILNNWIGNKNLDPKFMFGSYGIDPDSQTENIGDNPIKSSTYGLSNLKIVAKNLEKWIIKEGSNYKDLNELYGELIGVYRRYVYHVVSMIGGVNQTLLTKGQNGIPYVNVPKEKQLNALNFLKINLWTSPVWLYDKKIISKIKEKGSLSLISNLQKSVFNRILSVNRLNTMISTENTIQGNSLSIIELIEIITKNLTVDITHPDILQRELQKNIIHQFKLLKESEKLIPEIKGIIESQENNLKKYFKSKKSKVSNLNKIHYEYCLNFLNE
ncbi:MAG: zinc-dependent metalloprotease [Flavobacteriaceae bacterium]|nr:zinc-dependent metalloprotease [Flavobacteriaceae bacterium]